MATEFSDEFEGVEDPPEDEVETGSESGSPEGSQGSAGEDESPNRDKRVNDLMSKWQSAENRAQTAERALAALQNSPTPEPTGLPDTNPEVRVFMDQILEAEIDKFYEADPRLAAYGIERQALWAPTPADVKANSERFKILVDRMETQIENRVMARHGVSPAVGGGRSSKPRHWDQMPSDEFAKALAEARRGF